MRPALVYRLVLIVFGVWLGVVAVRNACDLLVVFAIAPGLAPAASGNFQAIADLMKSAHPPKDLLGFLLAGAALCEAVAAAGFLRAGLGTDPLGRVREAAFGVSLALFGAFFIIDELFRSYQLGSTHRDVFLLLLLGYLVTWAAPGGRRSQRRRDWRRSPSSRGGGAHRG